MEEDEDENVRTVKEMMQKSTPKTQNAQLHGREMAF